MPAHSASFWRDLGEAIVAILARPKTLVAHVDNWKCPCAQVLSDIETAQRNNRLYSALKEGNTALSQLQKQVTLEDVEKLNDEAAEAAEYQERLRELLGETLTAEQDAAALEELEKIQAPALCPSIARPQVLPCTQTQRSICKHLHNLASNCVVLTLTPVMYSTGRIDVILPWHQGTFHHHCLSAFLWHGGQESCLGKYSVN